MNAVNPYKPVYPVGDSPAFIGRDELLREVVRVMRHSPDYGFLLYGQRRIGKTSILRELLARLPRIAIFHPVYFDLLDKTSWSLGEIVNSLAVEIAKQYNLPLPRLGENPAFAFSETWLPEFLNELPAGHMLILLLDEVSMLVDPRTAHVSGQFFPFLRGLLHRYSPRLKFLAVLSRNVNELSTIALQLFKGLRSAQVSLLSKPETVELIRISESEGSLLWSEAAVEKVWALTSGHPLLTQQLCAEIWRRARQRNPESPPVVEPQIVDECTDRALEEGRNSLEWLWNGLPSAGRVVVSALAEAGASPITEDELIRILSDSGVRVVIRELQEAPRLLQEWDLIEPGPEPYRFRVELLRRWIARKKPLERVKEEMDYIEPLAENLYQAAARMYQHRQNDQAVLLLRQAVEANPNHERANMLLADVLTALGQTAEALDILEPLYLIRPFAIWPRLARLLLAKARDETNEEIRLETFQRILEVEPTHNEARLASREIWRRRAKKLLADEHLEEAYAAFLQAGMQEEAAQLEEKIRRLRLQRSLKELRELETSRQFTKGLALAEKLQKEFSEYPAWAEVIAQFRTRVELYDLYHRALAALDLGDRSTAAQLFSQVAVRNPAYEEVTRYLHLSVTGVDIAAIQRELDQARRHLSEAQVHPAPPPPEPLPATKLATGPLFHAEPPFPARRPIRTKPSVTAELKMPGANSDPATRLRYHFQQIRNGHFSIIGLPLENSSGLVSLAARLASEEGLVSFTGSIRSASPNPNYAVWHAVLQGVFGIDRSLPVEMQARQLRDRLVDLDTSYLTYLSKVSMVVLDVPVPGQTVLKLMTPQEIQAKTQEIIVRALEYHSRITPLLLVMPEAHLMDPMSLHLMKGVTRRVGETRLGFLLTYPAGSLDTDLCGSSVFAEIG